MKKLIIAILIITLALVATPASAYTPPGQGTDNATDVILWYGNNLTIANGNLTIIGANVTIDGLEDAITAAGEAQAEVLADAQEASTEDYIALLLVAFVTGLAFWQRSIFLYSITAPLNLVYGLSLATEQTNGTALWVAGLIVAIIGTFCLMKAVSMGFSEIKLRLRRR